MMNKIKVPRNLKIISSIINQNGFECYLVGGGVRDQLLGLPAKDYDLATSAEPADIQKMFHRVIPTGIQHGTVSILFKGETYEVTTYRIDGEYTDGRRPDEITYTQSIEEDLKRRDFTINSIAYNIEEKKILDPNGGRADLKKGIIRAIGVPEERFNEDGLRSIRACRFASQLNFVIEEKTLEGIKKTLNRIPPLSKERIYDELVKIMKTPKPSKAFRLFSETGILELILPDLSRCIGIDQKGRHIFDVFDHIMHTLDAVRSDSLEVYFSALFHDIGKPVTRHTDENGVHTFYNHEKVSSDMAEKIMQDYRFPRNLQKNVCHLIANHMFHYQSIWTDSAVRRFISRVGVEHIDRLLELNRADSIGHDGIVKDNPLILEFIGRIDAILEEQQALTIKDLAVNGHLLAQEAGIPKGPEMGSVMNFLLESVLEDPQQNTKETLVNLARNFYIKYS